MNEIEKAVKSCNEEIQFYKHELKEPYMNQELCAEQDYCQEQSRTHCLCNSKIKDFQFIIAVLRENQEREKGCEFCRSLCRFCNVDSLDICDECKNHSKFEPIEHKRFCPNCGRKLEDKDNA